MKHPILYVITCWAIGLLCFVAGIWVGLRANEPEPCEQLPRSDYFDRTWHDMDGKPYAFSLEEDDKLVCVR